MQGTCLLNDIHIPYIQHQIFKDHNFHGWVFNCKIAPSKMFGRCMYVYVVDDVQHCLGQQFAYSPDISLLRTGFGKWWRQAQRSPRVTLKGECLLVAESGYRSSPLPHPWSAKSWESHSLKIVPEKLVLYDTFTVKFLDSEWDTSNSCTVFRVKTFTSGKAHSTITHLCLLPGTGHKICKPRPLHSGSEEQA